MDPPSKRLCGSFCLLMRIYVDADDVAMVTTTTMMERAANGWSVFVVDWRCRRRGRGGVTSRGRTPPTCSLTADHAIPPFVPCTLPRTTDGVSCRSTAHYDRQRLDETTRRGAI